MAPDRGDHEAAVEEVVEQFATRLADQEAAVAGRALQVRRSLALSASCWAQTGSFEQSRPISRADFR